MAQAPVSLRKMSKKAQKERARARRNTWEALSPVTRVAPSKKVYSRKRVNRQDLTCD